MVSQVIITDSFFSGQTFNETIIFASDHLGIAVKL